MIGPIASILPIIRRADPILERAQHLTAPRAGRPGSIDGPGIATRIIAMSTPEGPTAILLIAHGSRRAEANADVLALAERIRSREGYPIVQAAFLELAEPGIPEAVEQCVSRGARRVLMVPYFLVEGVHIRRDLTAHRDAMAERHPGADFRLGPPLGPHPLLDRLVALRIGETAGLPGDS
jgi:sirohydrochlorin ferrochelatase